MSPIDPKTTLPDGSPVPGTEPQEVTEADRTPTLTVEKTDRIKLDLSNEGQIKDFIAEAVLKQAGYAGTRVVEQQVAFSVSQDGRVIGMVVDLEVEPMTPTIRRSVGHAANSLPVSALEPPPNFEPPPPPAGDAAEKARQAIQRRRDEAARVQAHAAALDNEGEDPEFVGKPDSLPSN